MVSRSLKRLAASKAACQTLKPHHIAARRALSFQALLTAGEVWFLESVQRISTLTAAQQARLHQIEAKIERGRK